MLGFGDFHRHLLPGNLDFGFPVLCSISRGWQPALGPVAYRHNATYFWHRGAGNSALGSPLGTAFSRLWPPEKAAAAALAEEEAAAAFHPHGQFGFRNILEPRTGLFWRFLEMQNRCPLPHQRTAFEGAYPKEGLIGGYHLRGRIWRRLGVDKLLKSAYENGAGLSGISAGAICWFDSGHSDSMSFYNPRKWEYIKVRGLGLINGVLCPHCNSMTLGPVGSESRLKTIAR